MFSVSKLLHLIWAVALAAEVQTNRCSSIWSHTWEVFEYFWPINYSLLITIIITMITSLSSSLWGGIVCEGSERRQQVSCSSTLRLTPMTAVEPNARSQSQLYWGQSMPWALVSVATLPPPTPPHAGTPGTHCHAQLLTRVWGVANRSSCLWASALNPWGHLPSSPDPQLPLH